jgi:hypothetical protein
LHLISALHHVRFFTDLRWHTTLVGNIFHVACSVFTTHKT